MNDLIDDVRIKGNVTIDHVNIYDRAVDVVELRKRVGMIFQKSNPFPKSIYDNVAYGPRINGITDRSRLEGIVETSLRRAAIWEEVKDDLRKSALALSGGLGRELIPSSFAWRHIMPWASSPVVDPLWSNDDLEILHDGTGVDLSRKVVDTLLQYPEVATELRVCTKAGRFLGNCGVCSKCTRTMITLEIAGALRSNI